MNLIKTKNLIAASVCKILLCKRNLSRGEYSHFATLSAVCAKQEDLLTYRQHLDVFHEVIAERFQDILNMNIPSLVLDPFENTDTAESSNLEEELLEVTTNEELKVKFRNGYQEFCLQKPTTVLYIGLWAREQKLFIAFPSSHLAESDFHAVANLLSRNRL